MTGVRGITSLGKYILDNIFAEEIKLEPECEREFEIDQENKIVGFKSKNCF